jgi:glycine dehydrogenase subunit 1
MTVPYIANTDADRRAMLATIGVASSDELFADVPPEFRIEGLRLPPALSEPDLVRELSALAERNRPAGTMPCFLGGGAYRHFIPSVVREVTGRSEFATAYTPYQAEISQGTLQTAFEFQSLVCELTGMDVANAGMYDGASALAEACLMTASVTSARGGPASGRGRQRIALLSTVHPHSQAVVRTYAFGRGLAVDVMPPDALALNEGHACLSIQQPNFFGGLEQAEALEKAAHAAGALFVVSADPISLGLFWPPGEYGADIVVGEGQSLGVPLSFGGPYLGLFACRQPYLRQMPGRLVGRTTDASGRTGYVLTLQTREQHIRRERATSNICTSQQLVALAAAVYLAALGKQGLRQVAELCYHKAHYAADRIAALPGYSLAGEGAFFKEFVVRCPRPPAEINRALLEQGNGLLLCFTEMNTREEIDALVEGLRSIR